MCALIEDCVICERDCWSSDLSIFLDDIIRRDSNFDLKANNTRCWPHLPTEVVVK